MSVTAYISVGSNIQPHVHIVAALQELLAVEGLSVTASSTFWRTPAIGRPEQEDYRNGIWQIRTGIEPHGLQHEVLAAIEAACGRVRTGDKYAARTLDLDLVLYGECVCEDDGLALPHPDLKRPWVAAGVLELAPNLRLPGTGEALQRPAPPGEIDVALTATLRDLLT